MDAYRHDDAANMTPQEIEWRVKMHKSDRRIKLEEDDNIVE
jgi:hypothetical protein